MNCHIRVMFFTTTMRLDIDDDGEIIQNYENNDGHDDDGEIIQNNDGHDDDDYDDDD